MRREEEEGGGEQAAQERKGEEDHGARGGPQRQGHLPSVVKVASLLAPSKLPHSWVL